MDGKDAFYTLAGLALLLLAGAAMIYVVRTTPTLEDCIKADGMHLTMPNGSHSCVSKATYKDITGAK